MSKWKCPQKWGQNLKKLPSQTKLARVKPKDSVTLERGHLSLFRYPTRGIGTYLGRGGISSESNVSSVSSESSVTSVASVKQHKQCKHCTSSLQAVCSAVLPPSLIFLLIMMKIWTLVEPISIFPAGQSWKAPQLGAHRPLFQNKGNRFLVSGWIQEIKLAFLSF